MAEGWTRRQVLATAGLAAAAVYTFDPHEICCGMRADAQTSDKELFEVKKIGDGVWAAVAAARFKTNCNAAVIETNDGVIVVDSHSKPSAAAALYKEIQGLTKKPVTKLINTHFHWDHWQGNQAYAAANPKLEVIATQSTKDNLTNPNSGNGGVDFIAKQLAGMPAEIAKIKDDIKKAPDAATKASLEPHLAQAEAFEQELKSFKPALPTRALTATTTLTEGGREIQLHVLGKAHTNGDLFTYLPKEKIVVTGDALIDWMPFLNDGYPEDWIATLTTLEKLDFTQIVPGHGEVAQKSQLVFFRGYLSDLVGAVKKASNDGANLADMQKKIGDDLASKYEAGMSKYPLGRYRDRIGQNVEMVYNKVIKKA